MDDLVGTWDVELAGALGNERIALEITRDGAGFAGVARDSVGAYTLEDVSISGDEVTGSFRMTKPLPMKVTFTVRVRGTTMTGKAKPGLFPASSVTGYRR